MDLKELRGEIGSFVSEVFVLIRGWMMGIVGMGRNELFKRFCGGRVDRMVVLGWEGKKELRLWM